MLLENLTYPQVEEYLEDNETILIPVGSVEQHSEYGLIGTDFITAQAVAGAAAEKLGLLVAPTLNYGVSPHHLAFKGSVTLSPTTFMQLVIDICLSLAGHGFRRLIFVNGHGGNVNSLGAAFQEIKMRNVEGMFTSYSWYEGLKETTVIEELFHGQDGSHATPSEISLTMATRPEAFSEKCHTPKKNEPRDYYWPLSADEMRQVFPDGRMGAASWLATEEKGRLIMRLAVQALVEKIKELLNIPLL